MGEALGYILSPLPAACLPDFVACPLVTESSAGVPNARASPLCRGLHLFAEVVNKQKVGVS